MRDGEQDHWFVYTRTPGRITASPVNGKGWAVFFGLLAATVALGFAAASLTHALHPLLRVLVLSVVVLGGVLLILRIAIAKGRPSG